MRMVNIGTTGMSVTELCHGTLILGRLQADLTPEQGAAAIRKSFDMGVNFYDTAQGYQTYPHLALGLKGVDRNKVVIASKSHARSYEEMKAAVEECLRELSLEQIGIFHLHQVQSLEDLKGRQGALDCLIEYKKRGIIRAIGASLHTIAGMNAVNNEPAIDVVFPVLNMRGQGIIDGKLEDMLKVLQESKERGKFVYAMKPLGGGHLYKEIEEAFSFLRELPTCDAIACGMKDEAEVEMNVGIFNNQRVSEEVKNRVHAVARRLIIYDRCIACGLCVDECDQGALTLGEKKAEVDMSKCILCGYCAAVCPEYVIRVV
jgi:aryl-alcohol dehydrogenase-like predicted oxidoreductase/NAD-dependent dihydropyrimidine dehydrogenase PreA subunit